MNVYDFDGTLFYTNCTIKFAKWCILRHPGLLFTYVPKVVYSGILFTFGKIPECKLVRILYSYLPKINDFDKQINAFWNKYENRISKWYLLQKDSSDLIISGSPECLVKPLADRLGVNCMATEYDRELGVMYGNLMLAKSKSRFIIDQGMPVIENFYSDSLSDMPIALCAENAFLVTKRATKPVPWPRLTLREYKKINRKVHTGWKYLE